MAFSASVRFITGMMVGLEFQSDEEDGSRYVVIDCLILRFVIGLHPLEE